MSRHPEPRRRRRISTFADLRILRSFRFALLSVRMTGPLVLLLLLLAPSAHACAVCFGAPNSPQTHGMNQAIFFLLGVVGFVQIGFISLFYTLWRRARELRRHREEWQVIDGGLR